MIPGCRTKAPCHSRRRRDTRTRALSSDERSWDRVACLKREIRQSGQRLGTRQHVRRPRLREGPLSGGHIQQAAKAEVVRFERSRVRLAGGIEQRGGGPPPSKRGRELR